MDRDTSFHGRKFDFPAIDGGIYAILYNNERGIHPN